MKEKIIYLADRMGMSIGVLFLTIYEARYHDAADVSNDVVLFDNLGIIPDYVSEFMKEVMK